MKKQVKILSIVPFLGFSIILLILYIKALKGKIDIKRFFKHFISCAFVGFIGIITSILFLKILSFVITMDEFLQTYGMVISFIFGGYVINIFTLLLANKYYDKSNHAYEWC